MPDCLFCGIAAGELDAHKLYEDDGVEFAFDHGGLEDPNAVVGAVRDHL